MSTQVGKLNHAISLEKAVKMTTLYRAQKEAILSPEYRGKDLLSICESFNREAIDRVLAQDDCVGMRIYYSMDETLKLHAIIVGINSKDEDILTASTKEDKLNSAEDEGDEPVEIVEEAAQCPPVCPPSSPLNPPPNNP